MMADPKKYEITHFQFNALSAVITVIGSKVFPDVQFVVGNQENWIEIHLGNGDIFFLYTDGADFKINDVISRFEKEDFSNLNDLIESLIRDYQKLRKA